MKTPELYLVDPNLGNPEINFKGEQIFSLTFVCKAKKLPSDAWSLQQILRSTKISLWRDGELFRWLRIYSVGAGEKILRSNNEDIPVEDDYWYASGFRWKFKASATYRSYWDGEPKPKVGDNPCLLDLKFEQSYWDEKRKEETSKTTINYHAVYLEPRFYQCPKDFTIVHATDLHISGRNDRVLDVLLEVRTAEEQTELIQNYVNWNDNFRRLIQYANTKLDGGEFVIIVVTGDVVDYYRDKIPTSIPKDVSSVNTAGYIDNFFVFRDLVIGKDGKGNAARCPIYTVLGNHDYLQPEPPLCGTVLGIKELPKYKDFFIKEFKEKGKVAYNAGTEYDHWADGCPDIRIPIFNNEVIRCPRCSSTSLEIIYGSPDDKPKCPRCSSRYVIDISQRGAICPRCQSTLTRKIGDNYKCSSCSREWPSGQDNWRCGSCRRQWKDDPETRDNWKCRNCQRSFHADYIEPEYEVYSGIEARRYTKDHGWYVSNMAMQAYDLTVPQMEHLTSYLLNISFYLNMRIRLGDHQLILFNTGGDLIPSKSEFAFGVEDEIMKIDFSKYAPPYPAPYSSFTSDQIKELKKEVDIKRDFLNHGGHNRGVSQEQIDLLQAAINDRRYKGFVFLFTHAPIVGIEKNIKGRLARNCKDVIDDDEEKRISILFEENHRDAGLFPNKVSKLLKQLYPPETMDEISKEEGHSNQVYLQERGFPLHGTNYFKRGMRDPELNYGCSEGKIDKLLRLINEQENGTTLEKKSVLVFSGHTHGIHEFRTKSWFDKFSNFKGYEFYTDNYSEKYLDANLRTGFQRILRALFLTGCSPLFFTSGKVKSENWTFREIIISEQSILQTKIHCKDDFPFTLVPESVSPKNQKVFNHYPRTTLLKWTPVRNVEYYNVEVQASYKGKWFRLFWKSKIKGTSLSFDFVGKQPGRWRVSAVFKNGQNQTESDWAYFKYLI